MQTIDGHIALCRNNSSSIRWRIDSSCQLSMRSPDENARSDIPAAEPLRILLSRCASKPPFQRFENSIFVAALHRIYKRKSELLPIGCVEPQQPFVLFGRQPVQPRAGLLVARKRSLSRACPDRDARAAAPVVRRAAAASTSLFICQAQIVQRCKRTRRQGSVRRPKANLRKHPEPATK